MKIKSICKKVGSNIRPWIKLVVTYTLVGFSMFFGLYLANILLTVLTK